MSKNEINRLDNTPVIALWTNSKGQSCVKQWSTSDLMKAFKYAEQIGDDVLYCAVMDEIKRRKLRIVE